MAERRSIRSLIGGWAAYWAVVGAVKLATTFTGTASLLSIALWVAGPPLVSWIVWAIWRKKEKPVAARV